VQIDKTLEALYDNERKGGLGPSSPNVSRWLGDIRSFFPNTVVQVMQKDALKRLDLTQMLFEKETLQNVAADVHLVATLMTLSRVIPEKTKDTARQVVRKVVDELLKKLAQPTQQAITGSLNRSTRNRRPRHNEINWHATILKNLRHYQPEYKTIIPETRIGYGRRRTSLKDVVLCLDQSGSMGTSVVYSGIFGSVMASIPAIKTKMVVFDTVVADLTEELTDPVELLFGVQLGGGTDIHAALNYCRQIITKPLDTVLVLITDLYEGGDVSGMRKKATELVTAGVQIVVLLALNDDGAPSYDHENAQFFSNLGVPVFACTPDKFPDLMAAALSKQDITMWAAKEDLALKK
jgi:Mg-chelatase subunit ChlD